MAVSAMREAVQQKAKRADKHDERRRFGIGQPIASPHAHPSVRCRLLWRGCNQMHIESWLQVWLAGQTVLYCLIEVKA